MPHTRQRLGRHGEDLACAELQRRGYSILARGHRSRFGEIDVVARDGGTLVFVEVKTRGAKTCGDPADAVTPDKQRRVAAMAADYLARYAASGQPCRFDVVTVDASSVPPKVTVYPDAFRPGW